MSRTRAVSHSFEASVHPECASKNIKRRALVPLDLLPGAPMGELMAEAALPVSRAPTNDVLSLLVVIDNLGDLADAYDSSLASVVSDVVHTRALSFCGTDAGIVRFAADRFAVVTRKGLRFENVAAFAAGAMTAIGGEPIRVVDIAVLAAVTVKILRPDVDRFDVAAMRSLGCRIAVDDFGAGNSSRHALTSLSLNFVKIDAGCLHRARVDARWQSCLSDLVGSAARLAETVIVEGIETPSDARLAREAGAQWLQGYLFGNPSSLRPPSSDPGVKAPCERGGVNGSTPTRA